MFKPSLVHTAIATAIALSSQNLIAAEVETEENAEEDVEVIQVSGIRASNSMALALKRDNVQITDTIISEDIGKFPDNNVVESLQRVTGVQVTGRGGGETSNITIRGLGDIATTVNGRQVFTGNGRSVALQDIPASLLNSVSVYKTRSAKELEGGLAGLIDVKTHRPFNFEGNKLVVAAKGTYQDTSGEIDPNVSLLASTRWESDLGEFGALVNLSMVKTRWRDETIWVGSLDPYDINTHDAFNQSFKSQELSSAPGSTLEYNGQTHEYVLLRDAMGWNDIRGERERPAANISLQWRPNDDSEYIFEAFYNGYRNEGYNAFFFANSNSGNNFRDYELYDNSNVVKRMYINNPAFFSSGDGSTGKTDSYLYALGGKWHVGNDLTIESELIYQDSTFTHEFNYQQANGNFYQAIIDFNYELSSMPYVQYLDNPDTADVDESDLTNPSFYSLSNYGDNGGHDQGDALTWTLDAEYILDAGIFETVSFGARIDKRTAVNEDGDYGGGCAIDCNNIEGLLPGVLSANDGDFFDGVAYIPRQYLVVDGRYLLDNQDKMNELYGIDNLGADPARSFNVEELSTTFYAQTKYAIDLGGNLLDGEIGFRYIKATNDLEFFGNDPVTGEVGIVDQSTSSSVLLPNLMMRYELAEDVIARFSYGESINRPGFDLLNPSLVINPPVAWTESDWGTASSGNKDLKPESSKNYDFSLEWYFAESSSLYGVVFKRDIEGRILNQGTNVVLTDRPDEDENGRYILNSPQNSGKGKLDGIEVGFQYFPDGLPELLDGIGIMASYTLIDSELENPVFAEADDGGAPVLTGYENVPVFGVSDSSYSAILAYEKEDFSLRLSYVYRSDYTASQNNCCSMPSLVVAEPEQTMDFQFSYDVNENLVLTFDAVNIMQEIYHSSYSDQILFNNGSGKYARTFSIGMRYSME
ncbi:TonB-dependent receptor [Catenovulum sp. SX2]|uniref:TonB-dependent receptor n=1 Tax=Catenovulum sp. SX2 TaxID=3398614 RepID=UPI003F83B270